MSLAVDSQNAARGATADTAPASTAPAGATAMSPCAATETVTSACACAHCSLPVPSGLFEPNQSLQFCCSGCRTAYEVIYGHGLEEFYAICEQSRVRPIPGATSDDNFDDWNSPEFQQQFVTSGPDGLLRMVLALRGVHCAACVWLLEKLPQLTPGVVELRVNLARSVGTVRWNPQAIDLATIARACARLGYCPEALIADRQEHAQQLENRRQLAMIAVAGACAGNAMLFALALYAGLFSSMASEHEQLIRWASAAVGALSLSVPGRTFFLGAWRAISNRTPHMDVSLALGLGAGGAMGLWNTVTGRGEIYFDSLCMLVFVLLVGRYVYARQQRLAADRVSLLRGLTPRTARRINDGGDFERVPVEALCPGDRVEVLAGELIPADCLVTAGKSTLDRAILTGEALPQPVQSGDEVHAGATNLTAPLTLSVTAVGQNSRVGRLVGLVESEQLSRVQLVELANRVSGVFLWVVLVLAGLTLWIWWPTDPQTAVNHMIALLIVACPCALGLATPLTLAVAQGRAAAAGVLIRAGDVFQRLSQPGVLWLDKTGTITTGSVDLHETAGDAKCLPIIAALETQVIHPLATAIVRAAGNESLTGRRLAGVEVVHGRGIRGQVDESLVAVGSLRWLRELGVSVPAGLEAAGQSWAERGLTPVYAAIDGNCRLVLALGDRPRDDAVQAIKRLRALGWTVGILSGDEQRVVDRVAAVVGVEPEFARGEMSPEQKLDVVKSATAGRSVVMVGDGVNDAAALAAASVGIAVHGGAEVSLQAAPVYLSRAGLWPLVELVLGSQQTMRVIRRNLAVSMAYNVGSVVCAVCGLISPLAAAILMPLSSLTVIGLSLVGQSRFQSPQGGFTSEESA